MEGFTLVVPAVAKSMVVGSGLLYFDYQLKIYKFDSTIKHGNCKVDPKEDSFLHSHAVDRSSLIDEITTAFIGKQKHVYGVVLGPTGKFRHQAGLPPKPEGNTLLRDKGDTRVSSPAGRDDN